jgi:hypothetical protein
MTEMSKNQIIETFNKHIMEFIMDIERVFPEDTDITALRKSLGRTTMMIPKSVIRAFNEHFCIAYGKEIEEGNLDFFIDNDYNAKHGNLINNNSMIIQKINQLRRPVRNMAGNDKAKVIQYLKNLKKLSEMYTILRKQKNNI